MQPLQQVAVFCVGACLTAAWWVTVKTRTLGDDLRLAGIVILLGAVAIALYEYLAWKRRLHLHFAPPRQWITVLRTASLAAVTPLLEKNAIKTLSTDVPIMFSMSRLVVLAFATGMMRQLWSAGIAGWPEATLSVAIVLALPILGALDRATPEQVVDVTKALVGRIGVGEVKLEARRAAE